MGIDPIARLLARGVVAGVAGTAAMTAYQLLVQQIRRLGKQSADDAEPPPPPESTDWSSAAAPAQVAAMAIGAVRGRQVTRRHEALLTNVMHWGYGTTWGVVYAATGAALRPAPVGGAGLAAGIMVSDYTVLPALGVYRPIWRYPPSTLALDLSYHLVYGLGVAGSYAILDHRRDGVPRSDTST